MNIMNIMPASLGQVIVFQSVSCWYANNIHNALRFLRKAAAILYCKTCIQNFSCCDTECLQFLTERVGLFWSAHSPPPAAVQASDKPSIVWSLRTTRAWPIYDCLLLTVHSGCVCVISEQYRTAETSPSGGGELLSAASEQIGTYRSFSGARLE